MNDSLFGSYPYSPNEKKPCHIKGDKIIHYIAPANNLYQSDLNMLFASTNHLTLGIFQLAPGSSYDPADIHEGDENYYVLQGVLTVQNTTTGEFIQVRKGESLFMPTYAYHKGYNFEEEELRVLFAIAPKVSPGSAVPADFSDGRMNQYKNKYLSTFETLAPIQQNQFHGTTSMLGRFPVSGPQSRKEPLMFYRVTESEKLLNIHGKEHPMLMKFFVSNDILHMGEFILPAGGSTCRASEPDSHEGDCILYVEQGLAVIYLTNSKDAYQVNVGEAFLIPENTQYQIFNYTSKLLKIIFAIAPRL